MENENNNNNNFNNSTCPYCWGFMYEVEIEQGKTEVVCSQCGYPR